MGTTRAKARRVTLVGVAPETDPRFRPGAYISLLDELYEVRFFDPTALSTGMLHIVNARTEGKCWRSPNQIAKATLEIAAPEVPDYPPSDLPAPMARSQRP